MRRPTADAATLSRRDLLARLVGAGGGLALGSLAARRPRAALAAEFPTKAITLLCGSKAGAPIDVMARELAKGAEKFFGQPVVVVNKEGGTDAVEEAAILAAPADGYTVGTDATQITAVLQMPNAPFKWTDFAYIIRVQMEPGALVVAKGSQFGSLREFVTYTRQNPGRLKVNGYGTFSFHHITMLLFQKMAGFQTAWIPYDSGKAALVATIGGNADATLTNPSVAVGLEDKVRVLGITHDKPMESAGLSMPTFKAQGWDLVRYHWRGVIGRNSIPPAVVRRLHDGFKAAMDTPEFQAYTQQHLLLAGYLDTADFTRFVTEQAKTDLQVLKEAGVVK
jgi:putative tricarboxylic transport membrane protein